MITDFSSTRWVSINRVNGLTIVNYGNDEIKVDMEDRDGWTLCSEGLDVCFFVQNDCTLIGVYNEVLAFLHKDSVT
jgi:hypothetical protein